MPLATHDFDATLLHPQLDDALTDAGSPSCPTCAHPVAVHDAIALRFCRATASQSLTRGCVCPQPATAVHL